MRTLLSFIVVTEKGEHRGRDDGRLLALYQDRSLSRSFTYRSGIKCDHGELGRERLNYGCAKSFVVR